jgi:hypothetical protein
MKLRSDSFADGARIPGAYAFAVIAPVQHVALSTNRNPHLCWDDVPAGARSFALLCHDPDVPSRGEDVNQEGREVPESVPRVDFYHWSLVDVPASMRSIAAASYSECVTPRGKRGPAAINGARQGINDYTGWFATDAEMRGDYFGYDGPCPPWNDTILHHYVFTLFALDVARLAVSDRFGGADARDAVAGHVLASASISGVYTLNPRLA